MAQAAWCVVLLGLQLGAGPESEALFAQLRAPITTILADSSAALKARTAVSFNASTVFHCHVCVETDFVFCIGVCCSSQCAHSLGLLTFIASGEIGHTLEVMKSLENIFRASYFKGMSLS